MGASCPISFPNCWTPYQILAATEISHTAAVKLNKGKQTQVYDLVFRYAQVVGLTASLGVGDTNDISKAVDNILQICANLDVENVSTVREHKEELSKYANTPERQVFVVSTRGQDVFLDVIGQVSLVSCKPTERFFSAVLQSSASLSLNFSRSSVRPQARDWPGERLKFRLLLRCSSQSFHLRERSGRGSM